MKFKSLMFLSAAFALAAPAVAATYVPSAAFSTATNPNGAYTYGYENSLGGTLTAYTDATATSWTTQAVNRYLGVYAIDASTLLLHPGPSGQYSVVRLTVPTTQTFLISGTYANRDNATTDVHVVTNGATAFSGAINGSGSTSGFTFRQTLTAGSTIDFAVGYGNGIYFYDSTSLSATITAVPEPATWALMVIGFGMVGAATRRPKAFVAA